MICSIRKLWNRRRVSNREIRKLMRKLPVLGVPVPTDANLKMVANMVKGHSFAVRQQRLYHRYLVGNMSYENLTKYRQMLCRRELIVTNSFGTSFAVDRKIVARAITRFRKMVG